MSKIVKRVLSAALALAMMVTMVPVVDAWAATTKQTIYKGEEITVTDYSTVKSVSSSKKSVVSVKKDPDSSSRAIVTAKKTGTATVTIKTSYGTTKTKYTVKKLNISVTIKDLGGGYFLLSAENKTKQTFDYVYVTYTLKDSSGNTVVKDSTTIYDCVAGKTSYKTIYYSPYSYSIDESNCSAKVTGDYRSLSASYTDCSSKVKVTDTVEDDGADTITLTIKSTNKTKKSVSGTHFILLYDAENNIIGLKTVSIYLKSGAVDTDSVTINYGTYGYSTYDHYEIKTVGYSKSY